MRSELHEAARRYTAAGWRVFPSVPRSKRPLVEWAEFQKRAPTTAEVDAWWTKTPDANLQVVTGNGIVCLDFDRVASLDDARSMLAREGIVLAHDVPAVQSGGSGWHLWLGIDRVVRPVTNLLQVGKDDLLAGKPQIDVRGDGSVATLPPSVHESGRVYRWAVPWRTPLPQVPPEFYALMERQNRLRQQARDTRARDHGWVTESLRGVGKGERARSHVLVIGLSREPLLLSNLSAISNLFPTFPFSRWSPEPLPQSGLGSRRPAAHDLIRTPSDGRRSPLVPGRFCRHPFITRTFRSETKVHRIGDE